jgi:D-glycero-D-manno-heptose 1,7-bisphosphate phosphatase
LATVLQAAGAQVHAILYCPHEKDTCNCRKPLPGMFEQAQRLFPGTEASTSVMIGDSLSDIRFGSNLGMQTIFIQGDPTRQGPGAVEAATLANHRAASLLEAVELLLQG